MARTPRRHPPALLVRNAIADPTARAILGGLSEADLDILAHADAAGQRGAVAGPILNAGDPKAAAAASQHAVGQVLAKLDAEHLKILSAACPPTGCP